MTFDRYRQYTQARIGLGNVGSALPTKDWLRFSYDHAAAVDAIRAPWDLEKQIGELRTIGLESVVLSSAVANREEYLLRPDLGRKLAAEPHNTEILSSLVAQEKNILPTVLIMASNGLSSFAIANHLAPFLSELVPELRAARFEILHEQIFLVPNARVALVDDLGERLKPTIGIVLIGERPGLSSPDSLALYLTHTPGHGRSDADRNCISNIRIPHGLSYQEASLKGMFLIKETAKRGLSGVNLKDESNLMIKT